MKFRQSLIVLIAALIICSNACPENCQQCDQQGNICFACTGNFQTNVMGGCSAPTIENCVTYGPTEQCFRCRPSFTLNADGKCEKSYSGCLNEAGPNECFQCGFGLTADAGVCKGVFNCDQYQGEKCLTCKPGYTLTKNVCRDSSSNCATVRPDGLCGKCKQGFVPSGFQCFEKSLKNDRCYVLGEKEKCTYCKTGYNDVNGKCLLNRQSLEIHTEIQEVTQVIHHVQLQNCQVPDSQNGVCLVCSQRYHLKDGHCSKVSQLCNQYNPQNGDCFECRFGLPVTAGKCVDKNCKQAQEEKCVSCSTGFKPDDNGICQVFDPNCAKQAKGKCQQCIKGFYLDGSAKCKNLPANCITPNIQTGACLQCIADFQIVNPGDPCTKKIVIENCETIDRRNAKCAKCVNRYFTDGNKCSKVSDLCRDYNQQDGKCVNCISNGFRIDNGRCVDPNCAKSNGDNCASCIPNFIYNEKQKLCKLNDPNCQNLATSQCLQCKPSFYVSTEKICRSLPSNCLKANPNGVCSICIQGFEINGAVCIKTIIIPNCAVVDSLNNRCTTCNNRFYISGSSCLAVPQNCNDYDQNGKCTSCKPNLILQGGTCSTPPTLPPLQPAPPKNPTTITPPSPQPAPQTSILTTLGSPSNTSSVSATTTTTTKSQTSTSNTGTTKGGVKIIGTTKGSDLNCRQYSGTRCSKCSTRYYVGDTGRCLPVNPMCKDYNAAGQCTSCYNGYIVSNGKCVVAQAVDPNCKSQNNGGCSQCYKGFYFNLKEKICKKLNQLCKSSNLQTGACTDCYPGYSLNSGNGNCEVSFKDPNCKDFNKDNTCKVCASKYFIGSNGKCSPANPLCKDFNQSNGLCTACFPGYGLNPKGQCIKGYSSDPNCKNIQGQSCKQCVAGFYLGKDGKCKQASPLCKTFDRENGNCLSCYTGYEVADGTCIVSKTADPFCKKVDQSGKCAFCFQGYISIKGKCTQQNPLCKSIDKDTGGCTSCWPGYSLEQDNCEQDTTPSAASNDPFCVKITDGVCSQCSNGYYFSKNEQKCTQADPQCKTHDDENGGCTSCYPGYTLTNGKCLVSKVVQILNCHHVGANGNCLECNEGTYLTNNQCKQVSILCGSYNKANGECTSCVTGHVLQDGACIFPAVYDQNCVRYQSAYCSKCLAGFFLSNYMCIQIDPNCTKFNQFTQNCETCANNLYPNGSVCE